MDENAVVCKFCVILIIIVSIDVVVDVDAGVKMLEVSSPKLSRFTGGDIESGLDPSRFTFSIRLALNAVKGIGVRCAAVHIIAMEWRYERSAASVAWRPSTRSNRSRQRLK